MSLTFAAAGDSSIAHGRYLTRIAGCNDCHTADYGESGGKVAEAESLTGVAMGFKGPWGVTYPSNLRLLVRKMDEQAWVKYAREPRRPPMPWFALRDMTDSDLRAIYRYIHSLGAKGVEAPAYAPPGTNVSTPWILFEPQNLPPQVKAAR